jgi:hypothetical protein
MPETIQEYLFTKETQQQWKNNIRHQLIKDNTNFAAVV